MLINTKIMCPVPKESLYYHVFTLPERKQLCIKSSAEWHNDKMFDFPDSNGFYIKVFPRPTLMEEEA